MLKGLKDDRQAWALNMVAVILYMMYVKSLTGPETSEFVCRKSSLASDNLTTRLKATNEYIAAQLVMVLLWAVLSPSFFAQTDILPKAVESSQRRKARRSKLWKAAFS